MNKTDFFKKLEDQLRNMPKDETEAALEYYREYFEEAGPENEGAVLKELGAPEQIAAQLKANIAIRKLQGDEQPTVKKGISAIWFVVLAIFAAPIALPMALATVAVVVSLCFAAFAVIIALILTVVAVFAAGIFAVVAGVAVVTISIPTSLFTIGTGMVILGITILLGLVSVFAARGIFGLIAKLMNRLLKKSDGWDGSDRGGQNYEA